MSVTNIAAGELTSMALCWRLERSDGAGLALTSHDNPIALDGVTHLPSPGMTPSAITRGLGLEPHSGEVTGALSSDALDAHDLALGRWNGAGVSLRAIDWQEPERPPVSLLAGQLGEVSIERDAFTADLTGAAARLERPVCPTTSPECRANFGDKQCRVDLAGRSARAKVLSSNGGELTLDRWLDSRFLLGRLRYLAGANCGIGTVVIAVDGATVRVRDLPRGELLTGCTVEVREGCDKRLETCADRFGNAANFRGEPHLPGNDLLTRYPGA